MSRTEPVDSCTITLGSASAADVFALSVELDGQEVLRTIGAPGPGLFRTRRRPDAPAFAPPGTFAEAGAVVAFLQRGALVLPVAMPERGWLAAAAPDGTRAEYGTPLIRYIRAMEAVCP
jgi:hypothetical protein